MASVCVRGSPVVNSWLLNGILGSVVLFLATSPLALVANTRAYAPRTICKCCSHTTEWNNIRCYVDTCNYSLLLGHYLTGMNACVLGTIEMPAYWSAFQYSTRDIVLGNTVNSRTNTYCYLIYRLMGLVTTLSSPFALRVRSISAPGSRDSVTDTEVCRI